MAVFFSSCLQIFPTCEIEKLTTFYEKIGFKAVKYLKVREPHVCLYKDDIEFILTKSQSKRIIPNREIHGYGYDAYIITDNQIEFAEDLKSKGIKIVKGLSITDYNNRELVFEDIEGRWIGVGMKQNI